MLCSQQFVTELLHPGNVSQCCVLCAGGFTGDELLKLWKGLFYCLWMQDKPLLQVCFTAVRVFELQTFILSSVLS